MNHATFMTLRRSLEGQPYKQAMCGNLSELTRKLKTATGAQARYIKKMIRLNLDGLEK